MKYIKIVTNDVNAPTYFDASSGYYKPECIAAVIESSDGRNFSGVCNQVDFNEGSTFAYCCGGKVSLRTYRRLVKALQAFCREAGNPLIETRNGGNWRCEIDG